LTSAKSEFAKKKRILFSFIYLSLSLSTHSLSLSQSLQASLSLALSLSRSLSLSLSPFSRLLARSFSLCTHSRGHTHTQIHTPGILYVVLQFPSFLLPPVAGRTIEHYKEEENHHVFGGEKEKTFFCFLSRIRFSRMSKSAVKSRMQKDTCRASTTREMMSIKRKDRTQTRQNCSQLPQYRVSVHPLLQATAIS
jgi:hypothetical protein